MASAALLEHLDDVVRMARNTLLHARAGARLVEVGDGAGSDRTRDVLRAEFTEIIENTEVVLERTLGLSALAASIRKGRRTASADAVEPATRRRSNVDR
jgi:hypothetical protein